MADQPATTKDIAALQKQLDKMTKLIDDNDKTAWSELNNLGDAIEDIKKRVWKLEENL
jgi:polyhydroxyalkanoate synthesis regulator phasin